MAQTAAGTAAKSRGAGRLGIALAAAAALVATSFGPVLGRPEAGGSSVSVIVREVNPATSAAERLVAAVGGSVTQELSIIGGFSAKVPAKSIGLLRSLPGYVRDVTVSSKVHFEGFYGQNSGVASAIYPTVVGADKAWRSGWTGSGVGVAIIDTGINATGDLTGKVVHSEDWSGEGDGVDRFGHGTFLAGLIAGSGAASGGAVRGVAPDVNLISLKIAGKDGSADITHVMAALQWAVTFKDAYNIKVINLSLGTDSTQDYRIDPLNYAVERAWRAGITVVVSASNRGPNAGTISKPADDPFVVTVGAISDRTSLNTNDDVVPSFSGAGPTASNGLAKPDLAAPGGSVISTRAVGSTIDTDHPTARVGTAYFKGSGTSFASAITSGAAALALSRNPGLTPDQVKARLVDTARRGPVLDVNRIGSGVLDAYAATASDSTAAANQGLAQSDGTGSLQASRGSLVDSVQTGTVLDALGNPVPVLAPVTGELTAQLLPFDRVAYSGDWTASQWYASQWYASQWYASQWYASQWYASQWYASQWYANEWA
jgi:serine protease AprX